MNMKVALEILHFHIATNYVPSFICICNWTKLNEIPRIDVVKEQHKRWWADVMRGFTHSISCLCRAPPYPGHGIF